MWFKSLTKVVNSGRVLTLRGMKMLFHRSQLVQKGGVKFVRDSRMSLDMSLGGFESDVVLLSSLLSGRDYGIGLDIGANSGLWSLYLAKHSTRIYAFEPDPEVRKLFENNLGHNPDVSQKVEVSKFAVSDKSETSHLFIRRSLDNLGRVNNGLSSLVRDSSFVKHSVPVTAISLDEFMHSKSEQISWIKVDVEGHELQVFQGAQRTLLNFPFVVWEMLFDHASDKELQLSTIMNQFPNGYSHFVPVGLTLQEIEKSLIDTMKDTNIFSLPNSWSVVWTQYVAS